MRPVVASSGTCSVILVGVALTRESNPSVASPTSISEMSEDVFVAGPKFDPLIVITVPVPACVGVMLVIAGGGMTVNAVGLAAPVPAGLVTVIFPVFAPGGTVVVIVPPSTTWNSYCATPPNFTTVANVKFEPSTST